MPANFCGSSGEKGINLVNSQSPHDVKNFWSSKPLIADQLRPTADLLPPQ